MGRRREARGIVQPADAGTGAPNSGGPVCDPRGAGRGASAGEARLGPFGRQLRTVGLGIALALILAAVIAAFCLIVALACYLLVQAGAIPIDFFTHPSSGIVCILLLSLMLAAIVSACIGRTLVRPISIMTDAVGRLAAGDFSHRLDARTLSPIAEIRTFAASFNTTAEELAGTELMRTNFISDFSHEFRTPITALSGFAQLLGNPDLTAEERAEYADIVVSEANRLAGLSERILTLSKLEGAAILPSTEPVALDEQIRRCVLVLEPAWSAKGITVAVDLDPCTVQGDAGYLAQVWTNLLHNAIKFSPEGATVSVGLYGGRLPEDGRDGSSDEAVCWISDCGPGIDEAARHRVFDKFYQADTSHAGEGNGLGLALCKRIVELHGGNIAVESRLGSGAVFEVRLPLGKKTR